MTDIANEMSTVGFHCVGKHTMQRLFHRGQQEHQHNSARQVEDRRDPFCIRAPFRSAGRSIRSVAGKWSESLTGWFRVVRILQPI